MSLSNARQLASEANAFDADLMARVRAHDPDALGALYDRHSSLVYGLGLRILGDPIGAEDLAQDVFLQLWRRADRFHGGRAGIQGWFVSLTRNRAIDRLRAPGARADVPQAAATADSRESDPNETAYAGELREAAARALDALPDPQRAALELAYFGGLTHQEIAERLESAPGTVKARIRQAMLRMRDSLGEFATAGLTPDTEE